MKFIDKVKKKYYEIFKDYNEEDFDKSSKNIVVKKNNRTITFVDGADYLPNLSDKQEMVPLKIKYLEDYKEALANGTTDFDFSELNMDGQDIQNVNLENMNLNIDMRKVFIPYGNSCKYRNTTFSSIITYGNSYLYIAKSNLKGNNVIGDLSFFKDGKDIVYIWYSEDTFDDDYKKSYPAFFLADDAPVELKEKFYSLKKVEKVLPTLGNIQGEKVKYYVRHELTFDDYLKYYEYLDGKYIGNFKISPVDYSKIMIVRKFGLEKSKEIFSNLSNSVLSVDFILEAISNIDNNELEKYLSLNQLDNNHIEGNKLVQELDKVQDRGLVLKKD